MRIIVTEDQFKRLMESEGAPDFNDGDILEFPGSTVSPTATVHDSDGDPKYGKPFRTGADRVAKKLSNQNNYVNGRATISRMG